MLRVRLFGGVSVEFDGAPVAAPASRRAWALLAFLALHPGLQRRAEIAPRFWPDVLDSSARGNLRTTLWALRSALGDAAHLLEHDRDHVGLATDRVWVDARAFDALVAQGQTADAVELASGDLLAGIDDDWASTLRDAHRDRLDRLVAGLAQAAAAAADTATAVEWARRRTTLDPLAEAPQRDLIQRHLEAGDTPAALRVYARLSKRLRTELGVAPARATRDLVAQARAAMQVSRGDHRPAGPAGDGVARWGGAEPRKATPVGPAEPVGRGRELAALRAAVEAACAGHGGALVLQGEAGIGKTTLAGYALGFASSMGAVVGTGAAPELGGPAPLSLWAELLRDLRARGAIAGAGPATLAELGRLVPDLSPSAPAPPPLHPGLERTRLLEAMVNLVESIAEDRPVVLLLEDLHAADRLSIELAGLLARRVDTLPVLCVITLREQPRRPELSQVLLALRRAGRLHGELALGALDTEAAGQVARSSASLTPSEVARVVDAADGNPLLLVESARALAAEPGGAPASLAAAVHATASGLSPEAWRLAEFAAVAGRGLDVAELRRVMPDAWVDAAEDVLGCGLLVDRDGALDYRHGLLRAAAYDGLPATRRAWLHEALAHALGPGRAAESARHLRLAGRDELAVDHLVGAAAAARELGALEEARGFLEEALEIVPREASLYLELAEVHAWRGDADDARATLERALALLGPRAGPAHAAAHLRAGAWLRGAICDPRAALRHYRAAVAADPAGPASAAAAAGSAWCASVAGDTKEAVTLIEGCDPGGDPLLEHDVASARGFITLRAGQFAEAAALLLSAADHARTAERPDLAYTCWVNACSASAATGQLGPALAVADEALAVVRANGLVPLELNLVAARAHILARLGRFEDARAAAQLECQLAARLGGEDAIALAAHDAGLVALAAGDPAAAVADLGRALTARPAISRPQARLALAEALVALGRLDEARVELASTVREPVGPADLPAMLPARFARVQGLIAAAAGDRAEARRRFEEAADGWKRRLAESAPGEAWAANIVDLGRPPILGLIEPDRELRGLERALAADVAVNLEKDHPC